MKEVMSEKEKLRAMGLRFPDNPDLIRALARQLLTNDESAGSSPEPAEFLLIDTCALTKWFSTHREEPDLSSFSTVIIPYAVKNELKRISLGVNQYAAAPRLAAQRALRFIEEADNVRIVAIIEDEEEDFGDPHILGMALSLSARSDLSVWTQDKPLAADLTALSGVELLSVERFRRHRIQVVTNMPVSHAYCR